MRKVQNSNNFFLSFLQSVKYTIKTYIIKDQKIAVHNSCDLYYLKKFKKVNYSNFANRIHAIKISKLPFDLFIKDSKILINFKL